MCLKKQKKKLIGDECEFSMTDSFMSYNCFRKRIPRYQNLVKYYEKYLNIQQDPMKKYSFLYLKKCRIKCFFFKIPFQKLYNQKYLEE